MPIRATCSGCGQVFQAPDAMAGKTGKCPKCGASLPIQAAENPASAPQSSATSPVGDLGNWADDILNTLPVAESAAAIPQIPLGDQRKKTSQAGLSIASFLRRSIFSVGMGVFCLLTSLYALLQGSPILALLCFLPGILLTLALYGYARNRARKARRAKKVTAVSTPVRAGSFGDKFFYALNLRYAFGLFWIAVSLLGAIAKLTGKIFGGSGSEKPGFAIFTGILFLVVGVFALAVIGILVTPIIRRVRENVRLGSGVTLPILAVMYVFLAVVSSSVWGSLGSGYGGIIPSTPKKLLSPEEIETIVQQAELPEMPRSLSEQPGDRSAEISFPAKDDSPGAGMSIKVCLPDGTLAPQSTPCVFIAPAGSNGFKGRTLRQISEAEYEPYVAAGMIVIVYEIDGDFSVSASERELVKGYRKYLAAEGGIINARLAMRFALEKIPEVDPGKLYAVGHSSAANLALVWGAEDDRIAKIVAYAPAMDMLGSSKEALKEAEGYSFSIPLARELIGRMSPSTHVNNIRCPTLVFHSLNDENVPFSTSERYVEQMKSSGVPVTFSEYDAGDHYSSMISPGISRGVQWLITGRIDYEEDQRALEAAQLAKNQSLREGIENRRKASLERAGIPSPSTRPGSANHAGSSQSESSASTSTSNSRPTPKYNSLQLSHAKSHADLARNTQIDFILGSDESAIERMRWSATRERPAVINSWAVGISVTGTNNAPTEIRHKWDFRDQTGPVGEKLVDGLKDKTREANLFGEWPLSGSLIYSAPLMLAGSEKHILDTARKEGIDTVVLMDIDVNFVGLSRVKRSSIIIRVMDLNAEIPQWDSKKLHSRDADANSTQDLIDSVLTQIDESYELDNIDEGLVSRDWVVERVRNLIGGLRSGQLTQSPLSLLCELRYYQARSLMTKEEVFKACDLLFGTGSGKQYLEGTWSKRLQAIEKITFAPTP